MDINSIIQQVTIGAIPPTWQVVRPKRSFFVASAMGSLVFAVAALAGAVYLLVSGTIVGIGVSDQTPPNVAFVWFLVDVVVLALATFVGIAAAIRWFRALATIDTQMLVLMPEGFVMRRGSRPKDTTSVSFRGIARMTTSVDSGVVYLIMQKAGSGQRTKVSLDRRFGSTKELSHQIAGRHAHFVASQQGAPAR